MLIVTPRAKEKLKEVLQKQTTDPDVAIRVTSNHSMPHCLDLVLDKEKKGDQIVESEEGIKVLLIRSDLAQGLEGMVLDYKETHHGADFTISKLTRH